MKKKTKLLAAVVSLGVIGGYIKANRSLRYTDTVLINPELDELTTKELRVTTTDGASLYVRVMGSGEPYYLMSHCWTGDHRIFYKVVPELAKSSTVVLYDQRGHGKSSTGNNPVSLEVLIGDLEAVISSFDASTWILAGHSMGGIALQGFLSKKPKKIKSAVLISTMAKPAKEFKKVMQTGAELMKLPILDSLIEKNVLGPAVLRVAFGKKPSGVDLALMKQTFTSSDPLTRGDLLKVFAELNLKADITKIDVPTFVLVGKKDKLTPPALAHGISKSVKNSTLVEVEKAGHMLPLEVPELVLETLLRARE